VILAHLEELKMPVTTPSTLPNNIESYQAAVAANPQSAEAHSNLGWGYYGQEQYAEAIKEFNEALALDANWVDAHYGLGLTLRVTGAKAEAVEAFNKAAKLAPQMADKVRGAMLMRLAHGQINQMKTGDWDLDKELRHHEG
jgi:tetratricopeptide (TPR) repeat protein